MQAFKKLCALLCAAVLLAGAYAPAAFADGEPAGSFETETGPTVITCTEVPLYSDIDDHYIGSGFVLDSVTYVPLLTFTEYVLGESCQVVWDQETETATIATDGLYIAVTMSKSYMVANDRYIYLEDGAYNINGTILVPIRELAKVFSMEPEWDSEGWAIRVDTEDRAVFASGAEFYDADDLYWLSHVIYSEAGNQPLAGKIGVGNVVMNRAGENSSRFADTVKGVIFQEGQFDVVPSRAIYLDPNEESIVAAKLCLEGCNTVGASLWFLNPKMGSSSWFDKYATFEVEIADHVFYA